MSRNQDPADLLTQNLIRDAEEDLQRERMQEFWRQWGSTIIGMCIMLVVGTGVGVAWREYQQNKATKSTSALYAVEKTAADLSHFEDNMTGPHLSMAWLARAAQMPASDKETLANAYANAAATGNSEWAWLGEWNALRVKMDDETIDASTLLAEFEKIAESGKTHGYAALAWLDAAILAGERLGDPSRALNYVNKAEALTPRGSATAALTADLAHLYTIRKQARQQAQTNDSTNNKAE